ncbi:MAG: helix-turn-helix transcriptional regulator [Paracoccus sp. (in: a-proteobacteria)]|nr:helix-turn-helix transcriptional regulator [Paracoccus sp. (in: a-proteobacteria)]
MGSLPNLAIKLAARREARGLTQECAADLLGVDVTTISRWEAGRNRPKGRNVIERLRAHYDLTQQELDAGYFDWIAGARTTPRYVIRGIDFLAETGASMADLLRRILQIDRDLGADMDTEKAVPIWSALFAAMPFSWRLLVCEGEVVGYWHYLVPDEAAFHSFLSGEISEEDITPEMLAQITFLDGRNYHLLISGLAIIATHRHPGSSHLLTSSLFREIENLARVGCFFSTVATLAVSPGGLKLCEHLGMSDSGVRSPMGSIYCGHGASLAQQIRSTRKGGLAELYRKRFPGMLPTRSRPETLPANDSQPESS